MREGPTFTVFEEFFTCTRRFEASNSKADLKKECIVTIMSSYIWNSDNFRGTEQMCEILLFNIYW